MSVKRVFVTCSFSILLLLLLMLQYAATYSGLIPADPEKPGKCVYRGDSLEFGTHAGPGPCQRLTCRDDGTILVEGCGKLSFQNCNRGERKYRDKPYPECCTLVYKCKKADGSSYYIEKDASVDAIKTENSV
uniref:SVWC domain-containing protein n=1 Tax=Glossina austeni TaxID=7395 RepID=A0A1A9VWN0_GLOAU